IGKSSLLAAADAEAAGRGWEVCRARGGELEQGDAFGIVRQLFERRLLRASSAERAHLLDSRARHASLAIDPLTAGGPPAQDALFAVLEGLCELCGRLAGRRPLLLAIDDAHWSDAESLRWIGAMAPRLAGVRALIIAATRVPEPAELRAA